MADDALHPSDTEGFRDVSAPASTEARLAAEPGSEEDEAPQTYAGLSGRNEQHPFSGPLAPLGASSTLKERSFGKPGKQQKLLPIILAIIGGIVILSCLGVGAVVTVNVLAVQNSLTSPQTTLDDFYGALHVKDYAEAYDQLSSSYQHRLTQPSFRATFELIGTIDSYQVNNMQTQGSQATATVQVKLATPDDGTVDETKHVQLIQENGDWKINSVAPGLTRVIWSVGQ